MDHELELWRAHRAMQEKHTYFLLAAAGACIGFALTQSKDMALSASMYPLGAALALWGVSFLLGCRHIEGALSITFANIGLLKMRSGRDPLAGQNPSLTVSYTHLTLPTIYSV